MLVTLPFVLPTNGIANRRGSRNLLMKEFDLPGMGML